MVKNTLVRHLGSWGRGTRNTEGNPSLFRHTGQLTGHQLSPDNFSLIGREGQDLTKLIKESIYIRLNNPTLNRNIGKFQLNHIWDKVPFSTTNLKIAIPQGNAQHSP